MFSIAALSRGPSRGFFPKYAATASSAARASDCATKPSMKLRGLCRYRPPPSRVGKAGVCTLEELGIGLSARDIQNNFQVRSRRRTKGYLTSNRRLLRRNLGSWRKRCGAWVGAGVEPQFPRTLGVANQIFAEVQLREWELASGLSNVQRPSCSQADRSHERRTGLPPAHERHLAARAAGPRSPARRGPPTSIHLPAAPGGWMRAA